MIVNNTKEIIDSYSVKPRKEYGQNFIINKNILEKITSIANVNSEDCVIEIGPGLGSLTEMLCLKAKKVVCYEIDKNMVLILQDTLKKYNNVTIVEGDFLKQDVEKDIKNYFSDSKSIKVVANLPYYITSPIIFKLLQIQEISSITYMVQKEFGDRFVGLVGSKDYGALTVLMNYYTDTSKCFLVGKNNFYPIPNVDSVVLQSIRNKKNLNIRYEAKFLGFIILIVFIICLK